MSGNGGKRQIWHESVVLRGHHNSVHNVLKRHPLKNITGLSRGGGRRGVKVIKKDKLAAVAHRNEKIQAFIRILISQ